MPISNIDALYKVGEQLESRRINIAESYDEWLKLGFCCSSFGEVGRELYHRLSCLSGKYRQNDCDNQFTSCLKANKDKDNPGYLLNVAKTYGIFLKDLIPHSSTSLSVQNGEKEEKKSDQKDLKFLEPFSQYLDLKVFNKGLDFIPHARKVAALGNTHEQSIASILSWITVLGTVFPNLRFLYSGKMQHCHLYFLLVAPAASGKSVLSDTRRIWSGLQKISDSKREENWKGYIERRKATKVSERELIPQPGAPSFFLPADTSTTALIKTIKDNGGNGIIYESELDTLVRTFKSDFGNFSDILRNNFHGETIQYNRRTGRELEMLSDTHFSAVLAGTESQFVNFFKSAENGLFSRFLIYTLPLNLEWRDQFSVNDNSKLLLELEHNFTTLATQQDEFSILFTEEQKTNLNRLFNELQYNYYLDGSDSSIQVVRRLALITLRIASICTFITHCDTWGSESGSVVCEQVCFDFALYLSLSCADVSMYFLNILVNHSKKDKSMSGRKSYPFLFFELPKTFSLSDFPSNVSRATAYRYLSEWLRDGLVRKDKGVYTKCDVSPSSPSDSSGDAAPISAPSVSSVNVPRQNLY